MMMQRKKAQLPLRCVNQCLSVRRHRSDDQHAQTLVALLAGSGLPPLLDDDEPGSAATPTSSTTLPTAVIFL